MTYDFSTLMERRGMDALAVDGLGRGWAPPTPKDGFDPIPMWVADMNFATVPTIPESIIRRANHPAYGYFEPREEYFNAIIRWQKERNGVDGLAPECIGYQNGVLGGVVSALNVLCSKGDNVLIHSPTYMGFTVSLGANGYNMIHSPLVKDGKGVWRMDFDDMEKKIVENHIHAAVFCSPHNPCGRVWERWELEHLAELFMQHDVYVVCDEIWSDIILAGNKHIPLQSISEDAKRRTVALYAPSKTFNLAGLVGSYDIIYDPWLRDRVRRETELSHYNSMNVLSMYALLGAYTPEGSVWVDELRQTLTKNVDFACDFIQQHFHGVDVSKPQGTYMLFLDCSAWCAAHGKSIDQLLKAGWDVGVVWQDGRQFQGPCHIRMNLALPLPKVQEAFQRLGRYVFNS